MERRLYRISRTILSSDADCQDALQEALIRAWMRRGSLRNEGAFDAWLIRILINECRILARRAKRHRHDELDEAMAAPTAPDRRFTTRSARWRRSTGCRSRCTTWRDTG